MRDPDRIKPLLIELEKTWQTHPELRLGQLILTVCDIFGSRDPYYVEDHRLDEYLRRFRFESPDE